MKLTKSKRTTIIVASLAVLLVALVLVWFIVIKPLTEQGESAGRAPVTPEDENLFSFKCN